MNCRITVIPRTLHFKRPAGTSRGVYTERKVWYIRITSPEIPERIGIGECAPLPGLSCDDVPDYEECLSAICRKVEACAGKVDWKELESYPSVSFGLRTAFRHFEAGTLGFGNTPFACGKQGIPINGLIWMGAYPYMLEQIKEKIEKGFRCIKLKIGAIRFEEELKLFSYIRREFSPSDIELRVDANGAFSIPEALEKLKRLSDFGLHSIEQPIPAGHWEEMARLSRLSPLPIALDEELIGHNNPQQSRTLLEAIRPQYIVIKPSLHGDADSWVQEADRLHIGWWATSALESNIGLNAIAQWISSFDSSLPQGLGTGMLFTDNVEVPLRVERDELWYDPHEESPIHL